MFRISIQKSLFQKTLLSNTLSHNDIFNLNVSGNARQNIRLLKLLSTKPTETETNCIYYGPLTPQIKAVKVFSLTSSIAGVIAQPIIIKEAATIGSTSLIVALCSVVGFFTFVTPVLLHLITRKYVTKIHYNPDTSTYSATTINFFLIPKQLDFTPDDVDVPELPGMFTTFKAKGKPLFVEARHFTDPVHYAKIMGYDKPMDFKLGQSDEKDKET